MVQFGRTFRDKLAEFFDLEDVSDLLASIEANLSEGRIKFVVLMDQIHSALLDLIVFINQNSKFDLYGVELEYYRHEAFEIVIPRLFGGEVKKDLQPTSRGAKPVWSPCSEAEYGQFVDAFYQSGQLSDAGRTAILELQGAYQVVADTTGGRVLYWRVVGGSRDTAKLTLADADKHYSIAMDADGRWEGYPGSKVGPQIEFLNAILTEVEGRRLLGRSPSDPRRKQWTVHLDVASSDAVINEFVRINQESVSVI